MKKTFTLLMLALVSSVAMATDYKDKLRVSINGSETKQDAVISVEENNGKYDLQLKNFVMVLGENEMPVGNIVLSNLDGVTKGDITVIKTVQNITIVPGDLPDVQFWAGPNLGEVPVDLTAEICGDKLYASIDIDMNKMLGQIIKVIFGTRGFQIENSDFEKFHTASVTNPNNTEEIITSDEPDNWHSFMSATNDGLAASLAWMAVSTPHAFASDITRPGSEGSKSLLVTSAKVLGFIVANGTVTTGRINAGSISADNTANHSYSDMSMTDTDVNGDAFYSIIKGRPDSLVAWVKFKQATPDANNPYATIRAVITDGTYYQDPEDQEYTNVVAVAANPQIESNDFAWQRLAIPFEYTDNAATLAQKIIHVTASTNANPGKGSIDSLYIDDMSLVYNCGISEVKISGIPVSGFSAGKYDYDITASSSDITANDIEVTATGVGTIIEKDIENDENRAKITITATSNDLLESKQYVINVDKQNSIDNAVAEKATVKSIYNIEGVKVNEMLPGNIYVVKYSDGKVVKVFNK